VGGWKEFQIHKKRPLDPETQFKLDCQFILVQTLKMGKKVTIIGNPSYKRYSVFCSIFLLFQELPRNMFAVNEKFSPTVL
jgi:hypothetical protein